MKSKNNITLSDVYGFLVDWFDDHRYGPTVREVQEGLGFGSTSTTSFYLDLLERRGKIYREKGISRGISLPMTADRAVALMERDNLDN